MPYLMKSESDRIALPSDPAYWVEMRRTARYGDKLAGQRAMLQVTQVNLAMVDPAKAHMVEADPESGRGVLTEIEVDAFYSAILERLITAWNLDGEDGELLPITVDNIKQLNPDDGDFLAAAARKRLGGRPATAEAPFGSPSHRPSLAIKSNNRMPSRR